MNIWQRQTEWGKNFFGKKVGERGCPVRTLEKKILKKEQEMFAVHKVAV